VAVFVITGGAGFIGSNLAEALLGDGHEVRVLDDFSTGRRENLAGTDAWCAAGGGNYRLIEGDIRSPRDCEEAITGADYVLHKAAMPSVQRSVLDPVTSNEVNINGTLQLLEASRRAGVKRFVFASSSSVYGESEELPKVETMPTAPISPYGLQKYAGETYCGLYHRLYGLPTVALRYFNVFGPRQNPEGDYAAVIPGWIAAARGGTVATVYGDGEQTRDFTFVRNVIQANLNACEADVSACGRAYNIACAERVSLNQLLGMIRELMGKPLEAEYVDPRAGDIRHSLAGIDEAQRRLGFRPTIDFEEGLRRTIEVI